MPQTRQQLRVGSDSMVLSVSPGQIKTASIVHLNKPGVLFPESDSAYCPLRGIGHKATNYRRELRESAAWRPANMTALCPANKHYVARPSWRTRLCKHKTSNLPGTYRRLKPHFPGTEMAGVPNLGSGRICGSSRPSCDIRTARLLYPPSEPRSNLTPSR